MTRCRSRGASRRLPALLAALLACLAGAGTWSARADAHAVLVQALPAEGARADSSPPAVILTFSETVTLLRPQDVSVVDERGRSALAGEPRRRPDDAATIEAPLRPGLPDGTYTVRYRILSADAHVIPGAYAFRVGEGPVGLPLLTGAGGGPSETGPWAVAARFLELVAIGGLFGLVAIRRLVWDPALEGSGLAPEEAREMRDWMRERFWGLFAVLALGSLAAEVHLLLVKSASLLGTGVLSVLGDPLEVLRTLHDNPFGSRLQLRAALLVVLFAAGLVLSALESQTGAREDTGAATQTRPAATAVMALLAFGVLAAISWQGHASQAPLRELSILADAVHLAAAATWIAGLAFVAMALRRVPQVAPAGGPRLAGDVLARFSRVALGAVALVLATGIARTVGELSAPADLWETAHGRSILYKLALLCPVAFLALRNRRVVTALRGVPRPNRATLALVRRSVALELGIALAIVVVAALLVAQVPGRVG